MDTGAFIRCEGLVKIYKVANLEVVALQGLDLQIRQGEMLGVVGASGSGKSTLMNILGGLDRPSAGRVWVDGVDLLKLSGRGLTRYRSRKVGFVWQQGARNLIPYLSAEQNITLPITLAGRSQGQARRRSIELLSAVGLESRRSHRLEELSGGEQQRVAIAVALANQPALLLADEPTGEVDTQTAAAIFGLFRSLNSQFGLTTVIVSHDLGIARHVDRVVSIRDGRTATETVRQAPGPAGAAHPAHAEVFEEVVLVDSAGRLQIPREHLERFNIRGRARLEVTEKGILVVPVAPNGGVEAKEPVNEPQNPAGPQPNKGWRRLFQRSTGRRQP